MSATGRGGARVDRDWYPTPGWTFLRLLEAVPLPVHPGARLLEPGAGNGALVRALAQWCAERRIKPPSWTAVEVDRQHEELLRASGASVRIGDFLGPTTALRLGGPFDAALGNPPYSFAEPFHQRARAQSRQVCFLLPLDFLGSAERSTLFARDMPDVYVLPQRPTFVEVHTLLPDGEERVTSSDAQTYAWFHWPEVPQAEGKVRILRLTEADVIRGARDAAPKIWVEDKRVVRIDPGNPFFIGR